MRASFHFTLLSLIHVVLYLNNLAVVGRRSEHNICLGA